MADKIVKGIIFDIDNTLLDFARMKKVSISESIDAMIDVGLNISKKKAYETVHEIFKEQGMEAHRLFQDFSKRIYGKIDYKIVGAAIVAHQRIWHGFLHTYPGVIRGLIQLKQMDLKLMVVSDASRIHAHERLYGMKIIDFFDVIVAHEDTHKYKPAKKPFLHALHLSKLKPEECIMVGDWVKGDVMGAKKIGMTSCLAKYGQMSKYTKTFSDKAHLKKYNIKPDYSLNKFEDIVKIVKKMK